MKGADYATIAVVAGIVYGLKQIAARYFSGNVLGFFGFCVLFVAGVYGIAYCCTHAGRWYRNAIGRD